MRSGVERVLKKRMNRVIKKILGTREEMVELSPEQAERFRKMVLDEMNAYNELVLDILDGFEEDVDMEFNEEALELLSKINEAVNGGGS